VSFDAEGKKIDSTWIGAGCFTSKGGLYEEGWSFTYNP
jgi:hypothetical protein